MCPAPVQTDLYVPRCLAAGWQLWRAGRPGGGSMVGNMEAGRLLCRKAGGSLHVSFWEASLDPVPSSVLGRGRGGDSMSRGAA